MPPSASFAQKASLAAVLGVPHAHRAPRTLTVRSALRDAEMIELVGVIANEAPAPLRARRARRMLDYLGMPEVRVAVGADVGRQGSTAFSQQEALHDLREGDEHEASALLSDLYQQAAPHSLVVLLLSAHTDVAAFVRAQPEVFAAKTARVVTLSGVVDSTMSPTSVRRAHFARRPWSQPARARAAGPRRRRLPEGLLADHQRGLARGLARCIAHVSCASSSPWCAQEALAPDPTAANVAADEAAAKFVCAEAQRLGVPLVVVTREVPYAAPLHGRDVDELAMLGHPIALQLRQRQVSELDALWHRASLPADDPARQGLPAMRDRRWFATQFVRWRRVNPQGASAGAPAARTRSSPLDTRNSPHSLTCLNDATCSPPAPRPDPAGAPHHAAVRQRRPRLAA